MADKRHKTIFETDLDNRKLNAKSKEVVGKFNKMGKAGFSAFKLKIAAAIGTAIIAMRKLISVGEDWIKKANVQARANIKVAQALNSTSYAAGLTRKELYETAKQLQELTNIGDEEILNNVTAQLLTFTNIAEQQFLRTQQAVLDISTVLDTDLKSVAIQLGKALNDPVANLSALSRSGIQFSEAQKKVIKDFARTNQLAEAQKVILKELERQYGGQAAAVTKATGDFSDFSAVMGDFQEILGEALSPAIRYIVDDLKAMIKEAEKSGDIKEGMTEIAEGIKTIYDVLKQVGKVVGALQDIGDFVKDYIPSYRILKALTEEETNSVKANTEALKELVKAKRAKRKEEAEGMREKRLIAENKAEQARLKNLADLNRLQADAASIEVGKQEKVLALKEKLIPLLKEEKENTAELDGVVNGIIDTYVDMGQALGEALGSGIVDENLKEGLKRALMVTLDYAFYEVLIAQIVESVKSGVFGLFTGGLATAGAITALQIIKGQIASFATGVENFKGGMAKVHQDEVIQMPAGTNVYSKTETQRLVGSGNETTNELLRVLISEVRAGNTGFGIKGTTIKKAIDRTNKNKM